MDKNIHEHDILNDTGCEICFGAGAIDWIASAVSATLASFFVYFISLIFLCFRLKLILMNML